MSLLKVCGLVVAVAGTLFGVVAGRTLLVAAQPDEAAVPVKEDRPARVLMYISYFEAPRLYDRERDCWEFMLYESGRIDYGARCMEGGLCSAQIGPDAVEAIRTAMISSRLAEECRDAHAITCSSSLHMVSTWPECRLWRTWYPSTKANPCGEAYDTVRAVVRALIADAREVRPLALDDPERRAAQKWLDDLR